MAGGVERNLEGGRAVMEGVSMADVGVVVQAWVRFGRHGTISH